MAERTRTRTRVLLEKELQRLRELAGLSGRELAQATSLSQAKISRIERGDALPTLPEAKQWLERCGADAETRDRVLALAESALSETRPWGVLLLDRAHLQDEVRERNAAAARVRNFQPTVIPGLLQTAEYARRILTLGRSDVGAALTVRLEAQQVLQESGRRFEFVIAEHVLRWEPGPGVRAAQLDRLTSLATLGSVDLAVLPAAAAVGVVPWHNFVIREPADGGPVYVTTELFHGAQEIVDPESVAVYLEAWRRLRESAVVGDDAIAMIRRHIAD